MYMAILTKKRSKFSYLYKATYTKLSIQSYTKLSIQSYLYSTKGCFTHELDFSCKNYDQNNFEHTCICTI